MPAATTTVVEKIPSESVTNTMDPEQYTLSLADPVVSESTPNNLQKLSPESKLFPLNEIGQSNLVSTEKDSPKSEAIVDEEIDANTSSNDSLNWYGKFLKRNRIFAEWQNLLSKFTYLPCAIMGFILAVIFTKGVRRTLAKGGLIFLFGVLIILAIKNINCAHYNPNGEHGTTKTGIYTIYKPMKEIRLPANWLNSIERFIKRHEILVKWLVVLVPFICLISSMINLKLAIRSGACILIPLITTFILLIPTVLIPFIFEYLDNNYYTPDPDHAYRLAKIRKLEEESDSGVSSIRKFIIIHETPVTFTLFTLAYITVAYAIINMYFAITSEGDNIKDLYIAAILALFTLSVFPSVMVVEGICYVPVGNKPATTVKKNHNNNDFVKDSVYKLFDAVAKFRNDSNGFYIAVIKLINEMAGLKDPDITNIPIDSYIKNGDCKASPTSSDLNKSYIKYDCDYIKEISVSYRAKSTELRAMAIDFDGTLPKYIVFMELLVQTVYKLDVIAQEFYAVAIESFPYSFQNTSATFVILCRELRLAADTSYKECMNMENYNTYTLGQLKDIISSVGISISRSSYILDELINKLFTNQLL